MHNTCLQHIMVMYRQNLNKRLKKINCVRFLGKYTGTKLQKSQAILSILRIFVGVFTAGKLNR